MAVELGTNLPNHLTQLLVPLYREESDSTNTAGTILTPIDDRTPLVSLLQGKNYIH